MRGAGLGEDRLQVVLDRVLGQVHALGDAPGVGTRDEMPEQLRLPPAEAARTSEEVEPLVGRGPLDGDGDVALGRRVGV